MAATTTRWRSVADFANSNPVLHFPQRHMRRGALLHTTSGRNSLHWLQQGSVQAGRPASADWLIDRDGTRHRISPPGRCAYHAGDSEVTIHGTRYTDNLVSEALVGIELEQMGSQVVTWEQEDSTAELLTILSVEYSWRWPYTIFGHYQVALPLGRRSDPQGLNWGNLMGRLYTHASAANIPGL